MQDNDQTTTNDQVSTVKPDMTKPFGVSSPLVTPDPATTTPATTAPTTDASQIFAPAAQSVDEQATTTHIPSNEKSDDALESIKEKALKDLTPLLDNLDQSPEEKYKTLMMVIQASDNKDLVSDAYDAAQRITDSKVRADALVGIINEINYFTQQK